MNKEKRKSERRLAERREIIRRNEDRREARRKKTSEFFTPNKLANEMIDMFPNDVWEKGELFRDPACGNGQLLIFVLWRKISKGHKPLEALQTIYGCDIMRDNIRDCRLRLLKVISLFETITEDHIKAVFRNIVFLNRQRYPKGFLSYDSSFKTRYNLQNVAQWLNAVLKDDMLEEVNLPVIAEECPSNRIDMFEEYD